ncbi:2Fe-2S iron-sulfur cluster binding domain-containing protein [Castellaniella sp.]|uniref:2Fe-2S iron-sulfur cluster binding domain-containing protein n=1 Tax=Castellaniella sp. TaxID=1955812 RepID=UPI002AFFD5FA|nr:2Fe-2S iron-sulfur cluster binding domain-containing protein [Castellaniella sp.]
MASYKVHVKDSNETFSCPETSNVLRSMECSGHQGIPVGCRGGGCGVCKVQVTSGDYLVRRMSRARVTEIEESQGVVLACQLYPRSDLQLQVIGPPAMPFGISKKKILDKI